MQFTATVLPVCGSSSDLNWTQDKPVVVVRHQHVMDKGDVNIAQWVLALSHTMPALIQLVEADSGATKGNL